MSTLLVAAGLTVLQHQSQYYRQDNEDSQVTKTAKPDELLSSPTITIRYQEDSEENIESHQLGDIVSM